MTRRSPARRRSSAGPKKATAVGDISNPGSGWSFTGERDKVTGYKITDVEHDGFPLAASISIERIGLGGFDQGYRSPQDQANYQVVSIGQMREVVPPTLVEGAGVGTGDLPLGHYTPKFKIESEYELTGAVYEPDQKIRFRPTFVFTGYGKDPSHEPGGSLRAARLYPMLRFSLESQTRKKKDPNYRRVTAIQVLFRLHIVLAEGKKIWNQAGVFFDYDDAATKSGTAVGLARMKPGALFFSRAEKPLIYEIAGKGVVRGAVSQWDNIHQWPSTLDPSADPKQAFRAINLPPTPGLPHGFHTHWRWGRTATIGGIALKGGPQYAGPRGAGFPLIDPAVPDQTVEFAIIQPTYDPSREEIVLDRIDKDPVMYLFDDFHKIWENHSYKPAMVLPSGDLVTWISITASHPDRERSAPSYKPNPSKDPKADKHLLEEWKGTLFSHGLFFAHEDVDVLPTSLRALPGTYTAQYLPGNPTQKWLRP
jgi:hypothetical protein